MDVESIILSLACVFVMGRPAYHGLAAGLLVLTALGFTIDYDAEAGAVERVQSLEAAGALPRI